MGVVEHELVLGHLDVVDEAGPRGQPLVVALEDLGLLVAREPVLLVVDVAQERQDLGCGCADGDSHGVGVGHGRTVARAGTQGAPSTRHDLGAGRPTWATVRVWRGCGGGPSGEYRRLRRRSCASGSIVVTIWQLVDVRTGSRVQPGSPARRGQHPHHGTGSSRLRARSVADHSAHLPDRAQERRGRAPAPRARLPGRAPTRRRDAGVVAHRARVRVAAQTSAAAPRRPRSPDARGEYR